MSTLHERLLAELDHARRARGRDEMVAALRAVVELHAPTPFGQFTWCSVCYRRSYPCSTIQAIARELGVDHGR